MLHLMTIAVLKRESKCSHENSLMKCVNHIETQLEM